MVSAVFCVTKEESVGASGHAVLLILMNTLKEHLVFSFYALLILLAAFAAMSMVELI